MPLEARYEIAAPDVIVETLDGEMLIVNLATGVYFRGDHVAANAWEAVTSGAFLADSIDADQAALAVFVRSLLDESLIRECTDPSAAGTIGHRVAVSGNPSLEKYDDLQDMLALDPIHDVDPTIGWPQQR